MEYLAGTGKIPGVDHSGNDAEAGEESRIKCHAQS
jgi:hypothetical protein